jgi:SAM-dependent methyltransferase
MNPANAKKALQEHRKIWFEKPVLRDIYLNYFEMIKNASVNGPILEIGGGSGNFKEFLPESISIDIVPLPWLDIIAHAHMLPFKKESFGNIVMIDVLHHIEHPSCFFKEADRILKPGGRIILIEPAITLTSRIFLHLFHPEPIDMSVDPFSEQTIDPAREPFDANQAIPTLLFGRYRMDFVRKFPDLNIISLKYLDLFAYPLSGGFRPWCLISHRHIQGLLAIERNILPVLGPLMAFRFFCVIKKNE